ncbi:MAG: 2Fe-2S iron-sulfur cluster-binding protein [Dehalococcoidia bacterium]
MSNVNLTIDGKTISAPQGHSVLWAALDNDIYIPNLCAIREAPKVTASCRLCFVEVEGKPGPVPACTEPAIEGMVVNTLSANAQQLARTALELLLASHTVDCKNCPANGNCELQRAAKHLGVKLTTKRFPKILKEVPIDDSHPDFIYDPNKCVLCGKCVAKCREVGTGILGFAHRGFERQVTTFNDKPLGESRCEGCLACVEVCPVGALAAKEKM